MNKLKIGVILLVLLPVVVALTIFELITHRKMDYGDEYWN